MLLRRFLVCFFVSSACCLVLGCSSKSDSPELAKVRDASLIQRPSRELSSQQAEVLRLNVNEEIILALQNRFDLISDRLKGNEVAYSDLFHNEIQYTPITKQLVLAELPPESKIELSFAAPRPMGIAEFKNSLWMPLLDQVVFEDTHFGILNGKLHPDLDQFQMEVAFEGRGRTKSDHWVSVVATQTILWEKEHTEWKICGWTQTEFQLETADKPLFRNVTQDLFTSSATLDLVQKSRHEELLLQRAKNPFLLANQSPVFRVFTDWNSLFQYPSVSVVDFDNDGFEDLFLTDRFAPNCLLRNSGDGKFVDVTRKAGLFASEGMSNCATFADFDNDGDQDLLLCRTFQPLQFFRNQNGKFKLDPAVNNKFNFIRFVSAASVIDVNRDGLLDVYLSTYVTKSGSDFRWLEYAVHPRLQNRLFKEITSSHSFVDRKGPPNVLLMNQNGNLIPQTANAPLDQWRNSYQSVWLDYDNDGDSDLYVCNDFAPDALLRNDTRVGANEPNFADVTDETFVGDSMGFGMGASIGDYNNDGALDLYVSNMYSKAGRRVVEQLGGNVDPRIAASAQGSFLFENLGGRFKNVAGLKPDKKLVAKVGWSFGGQFADFNNDTLLDMYVPSGFFTAPGEIAEDVDL